MTARRLPSFLALFLLAMAALMACAKPAEEAKGTQPGTDAASLVRRDDGPGGMTVEATWMTAETMVEAASTAAEDYPTDRYVQVLLKLDTHSVDLSAYDLAQLATLRGREGGAIPAAAWVGTAEASHHREGLLVFPGSTNERWAATQKRAQLTVTGIAGTGERVFVWEW